MESTNQGMIVIPDGDTVKSRDLCEHDQSCVIEEKKQESSQPPSEGDEELSATRADNDEKQAPGEDINARVLAKGDSLSSSSVSTFAPAADAAPLEVRFDSSTTTIHDDTSNHEPASSAPRPRPTLTRQDASKHVFETSHFQVPSSEDELWHAKTKYGSTNWRVHILEFLEQKPIEYFMLILLLADVLILFAELYVQAEYPSCVVIQRDAISCCPKEDEAHRFLGGGGGGHGYSFCEEGAVENEQFTAGCDPHKYDAVHSLHNILFISSMTILSIFLLELFCLIVCLGPDTFFQQAFYTLDFVVVATSWGLELSFRLVEDDKLASIAGILIIARLWRFIRIGHGIVEATVEMAAKKHDKLLEYIETLEGVMADNNVELPEADRKMLKRLKGLDSTVLDNSLRTGGGKNNKNHSSNHSDDEDNDSVRPSLMAKIANADTRKNGKTQNNNKNKSRGGPSFFDSSTRTNTTFENQI